MPDNGDRKFGSTEGLIDYELELRIVEMLDEFAVNLQNVIQSMAHPKIVGKLIEVNIAVLLATGKPQTFNPGEFFEDLKNFQQLRDNTLFAKALGNAYSALLLSSRMDKVQEISFDPEKLDMFKTLQEVTIKHADELAGYPDSPLKERICFLLAIYARAFGFISIYADVAYEVVLNLDEALFDVGVGLQSKVEVN